MSNRTASSTQRGRISSWSLLRFSVFFLCASAPLIGVAQETREPSAQLRQGMSFYDVLKAWGPPREKKESEAKREEVWQYESGKVIFQDGKAVAWTTKAPGGELAAVPLSDQVNTPTASTDNGTKRKVVEEILGEIMATPGEAP